jgi:hypothetical protein
MLITPQEIESASFEGSFIPRECLMEFASSFYDYSSDDDNSIVFDRDENIELTCPFCHNMFQGSWYTYQQHNLSITFCSMECLWISKTAKYRKFSSIRKVNGKIVKQTLNTAIARRPYEAYSCMQAEQVYCERKVVYKEINKICAANISSLFEKPRGCRITVAVLLLHWMLERDNGKIKL